MKNNTYILKFTIIFNSGTRLWYVAGELNVSDQIIVCVCENVNDKVSNSCCTKFKWLSSEV